MRTLTPRLDMIPTKNWTKKPNYNRLQMREIATLLKNRTWVSHTTREFHPVGKMPAEHITNVINAFKGTGKTKLPVGYLGGRAKWLKIFNEELNARKTAAKAKKA